MRKKVLMIGFIAVLASLLIYGCSGGPGSPGSWGFENVGAWIDVVDAVHMDPSGEYGDVWQFDLVQNICDEGPPVKYEKWGDDFAILTFKAYNYDSNYPAGTMYIKRYRVEFTPQNFNFGLPPIVEADLTYTLAIEPDGDEVTGSFLVLSFGNKSEIVDAMNRGIFSPSDYPLVYDMKITFYGEDRYGNNFGFVFHRTVDLFDVQRCS
jgi:hypothetical protein